MHYNDLSRNLLGFCTGLRLEGFTLGPGEVQDALHALDHLDLGSYEQVKQGLALIFCTTQQQEALFDILFRAYFLPVPTKHVPPEAQAKASEGGASTSDEAPQKRQKPQGLSAQTSSADLALPEAKDTEEDAEGSGISLAAFFSPFAASQKQPITPSAKEQEDFLQAAAYLLKRLRLGRSRRWRAMAKGARFHLRRTLRKALQTGGEAIKPAYLGHPLRKPRGVFLLDASRSMATYTGRLLGFASALVKSSSRVEVFVFSTSIKRITKDLKRSGQEGLRELGEAWGGGTKIGSSLRDFVRRYSQTVLTGDTLVFIGSDGLDTDDSRILAQAMREIHHRSASVVWLNPLLSTPSYTPSAAGMKAALPYIDSFVTVESADDIIELSKQIRLRR